MINDNRTASESRGLHLDVRVIADWPKLAWVASIKDGANSLKVLCGPMVEIADDWIVEAVWAGDFGTGDFDRTDLVFGSGIRRRGDDFVFVSSGTVFDRLWRAESEGSHYVSNSLPALLAVARLSLRPDYLEYARDVRSITGGLENRVKSIPTQTTDVIATYFHNILYHNGELKEVPKPDCAPQFTCYDDYRRFLKIIAEALGENLGSPLRRFGVKTLASISSGYDSCAAAVVSREAGCADTVTIKESTSFWRGSDSGAHVAKSLGMTCGEYPRTAREYPFEDTVWAATGWPGTLNWTCFDFPEPLCLFFTGCHGEKLWDRVSHDHPDPFVRRDVSSLGFCEFRLSRGVWQCVVPFWGVRRLQELKTISNSDEMRPWCMHKDYDKPVARRIVEEAGVPRWAFGRLKKNSTLAVSMSWPYSAEMRKSFRIYLKEHGVYAPAESVLRVIDHTARIDNLLYRNTLKKLKVRRLARPWQGLAAPNLLLPWANEKLKAQYAMALDVARSESELAGALSNE